MVALTVAFQDATTFLRQEDSMFASARDANRIDEARLAKMPQVAGARIELAVAPVPKVATGDHSKRSDGRQRAGFRTAQGVVAIAHDLALEPARQVDVAREHVARMDIAVAIVTLALRPPRVVIAIAPMILRMRIPRISWLAAESPRIVVSIS